MMNEQTIDEIIKAPARETWQYGVKTAWYTLEQVNAALAAKDAEIAALTQRLTDSGCDLQAPTPESGEWVEWNGGKCPIADGVKFQFKFRDGSQGNDYAWTNAPEWIWANRGYGGDIVAYRIIP